MACRYHWWRQRDRRLYSGNLQSMKISWSCFPSCREYEINQKKEELEKVNEINKGHQAKVNGFHFRISWQLCNILGPWTIENFEN